MTDFERDARLKKARVIAATCRDHGWSGADIVGLNQTERAWVCEVAKVNEASPQTWAVVIGLLGATDDESVMHPAIRAALPDDPFEGLAP